MGISSNRYSLVKCQNCDLIFLETKNNEQTNNLYPKEYIAFKEKISHKIDLLGWINQRIGLEKKYRAVFRKIKRTGNVLDVGCATGLLLDIFNAKGWKAWGIEPSEYAANYARNELGLNVLATSVQKANYPDGQFDVVMLWDVLEHFEDPFSEMKELARILKPGGWLIINIPNINSFDAKIFKHYWAGWDLPRHKYLFSRKTLEKLIMPMGLSIKDEKSITGAHGGLVLSLNFVLQDLKTAPAIVAFIRIIINSFGFRLITYPFLAIENFLNKSSYITYFVLKNG